MRLFTKGLLLVALPSAFQFLLLAALFVTQEQTDDAVKASLHSREVLEKVDDIISDVILESGRFRGAILAGVPSMAPQEYWAGLDSKITSLLNMVGDNPKQLTRAVEMRHQAVAYRDALQKTLEITLSGDRKAIAERYQALLRAGALTRLRANAAEFLEVERQLESQRLAKAETARSAQRINIVLAIGCSFVLSVLASYIFARSVGLRIGSLTANARRLAERQPLAPVMQGDDEIAQLDRALHEASERRDESERQALLLQSERAARADAEHATRLKDEFVTTLSHELRTPLNAIIGWSQILLRKRPDEATLDKGLDVIHRNAQLQAKMVNDLLEMSRILTGHLRLDLQRVNLAEVIEQVVLTMTPTAETKQVRIVKILGSAEPIQGDPSRLNQIVWNLLSNAVKFTPKGGKVQVSLSRIGSEVMISVTDTGQGIAAAFLPHVFDRFRQEDTGLNRTAGGLGLGLAIVRQLVELHGGRVEAFSDGDGKGATFTARFPVPSAYIPDAVPMAAVSSVMSAGRPLEGAHIAVLEDDQDARELVIELLREAGAEVQACVDGAAGLALLESRDDFDLILSDIGMPGIDGYEFARRYRRMEKEQGRRTLPLIALTALARTEDRQNALLAGFQTHIAKPVNPTELTIVAASALGRTGVDRRAS